jgi:methyl-galactoside transport system substrate-binding protein
MKEMRKRLVSAGLLLCMLLAFFRVEQKEQVKISNLTHVGVSCYDSGDTFINALVSSFQEQVTELQGQTGKIVVTVGDAQGSQRTQNEQVEEYIRGGCDVLCVNLVDRTDPSEIIDMARENDIPVIFFNREPVEEDMQQWDKLYYVGADSEQSGVLQGELAAEIISQDESIDRNKDGKIQYVVLEGEPGHQDSIMRTESAVATLIQEGVPLEKLGSGIANWNRAQAQNRMAQLIAENQMQIELVLANNDDMALGAYAAYQKLNCTESAYPVFFGIDGTDVGLEGVRSGKLAGTIYNDKEGQAEAMAELVRALVTGGSTDGIEFTKGNYIYLPYEKVTVETVGAFIRQK